MERVQYLRTLPAVREQAEKVFEAVQAGRSQCFVLHEDRIDAVAQFVCTLARSDYASLDAIPYHSRFRHFEAGTVDRLAEFRSRCVELGLDEAERARALIDLVFVSVLLDAGAGAVWVYNEAETGLQSSRSEGLGVATFRMFLAGMYSDDPTAPLRASKTGLEALSVAALAQGFQVSDANPMAGLEGRSQCVRTLGESLAHCPQVFEREGVIRPGHLYDYLLAQAHSETNAEGKQVAKVSVEVLWDTLMRGLERMWPSGRLTIAGANMGDVWPNTLLADDCLAGPFSPFHKLSQWLAYSLLEALELSGMVLTDTHLLTGLPEYRNGGLLIDMGVLEPLIPDAFTRAFDPSEQFIVEWRALTVAVLDRVGRQVRVLLGLSEEQLPLAKILEAGTWKAGRRVAKERRDGGGPPIAIASDGTVF